MARPPPQSTLLSRRTRNGGPSKLRAFPDWLPHNPPGRGGEHVMLGAFVTGDGYAPMDPNGYGIECIAGCRKP
jgi:hypothetical protein